MPHDSPVCSGIGGVGYKQPMHWQKVQEAKKGQQNAYLARWLDAWRSMEENPEATWQRVPETEKDVTRHLTSSLTTRERELVEMDATALLERLHHPDLLSSYR